MDRLDRLKSLVYECKKIQIGSPGWDSKTRRPIIMMINELFPSNRGKTETERAFLTLIAILEKEIAAEKNR
jgi:hypothetical protein